MSSAEQRDILSVSFEPAESGYIYYHNRWSRGIPVTEKERNEYLGIPMFGSRRAWRRSLEGRETLPPRAYRPVARKLLRTVPPGMAVTSLIVGLSLLLAGMKAPGLILAVIYCGGGCACLAFGGSAVVTRLARRDADAG